MTRGRYNFGTQTGNLVPSSDDAYDLGSSTKEFKDLYVDGTAHVDALEMGGNITLTGGKSIVTTSNGNITMLPNGTGMTIIGDAGATDHSLNANDDLFVSGRLEVDGVTYLDGGTTVKNGVTGYASGSSPLFTLHSATGGGNATVNKRVLSQTVTISAGNNTADTTTVTIPVKSTITSVMARVTQAPGGGPTNFNVGITGGDVDAIIDNGAVTVNGTFDAWEDGDGTYDNYIPVPTAGGAITFTVTTTNGSDVATNVTGASFIVRIVVFYDARTLPTS